MCRYVNAIGDANSGLRKLMADFNNCPAFTEAVSLQLLAKLPTTLTELALSKCEKVAPTDTVVAEPSILLRMYVLYASYTPVLPVPPRTEGSGSL